MVARTIVTNITTTPADVRRGLASPPVSKALMVVVLVVPMFFILGTLAAIAVRAYSDYKVRSQVTAELGRVADYKARVEARVRSGELLAGLDNESIGMPEKIDGRFVSSIEVQDGMVRVWFGDKDTTHPSLQGQVLTYTPAFHKDGGFRWLCGYAPPPPDFTVIDREYCEYTTILRRYLPGECR
jgi:Tfp pilus assembly major pilin PilA